ncbi:MAG: Rrf2 family transcriptional regulator [Deltaproteobacteria bacterium]|nr:Rrf2 family transcriptional regulator [Deltaproteobacteria bacterium]
MRLTRAAEYAVRCILYMSGREEGALVGRGKVTRAMGIPKAFMAKIAQQLAKAGFIQIVQGAGGGYRLRLPPKRITLLDVVEAVNGSILLNDCLMGAGTCSRDADCPVHRVWRKAREGLRDTLREADFERLAREEAGGFPKGPDGCLHTLATRKPEPED